MRLSQFWQSGGRCTLTKEWQQRDLELRREHWQGKVPAELIGFEKWRKLPKHRREAIEAAAYRRAGA